MAEFKIKKEVLDSLAAHAKKEAPIEACGYLAGKDGVVSKHYELTNIDESEEHFSFDPKEQFDVVKDARANGLDVIATYHSHPVTPARPSNEDIRLAYDPNIRYVIVSLAENEPTVNSYQILKTEDPESSLPKGEAYDINHDAMIVALSDEEKETTYLIKKDELIAH